MVLSSLLQSDALMYCFWGFLGVLNLGLAWFLLNGKQFDEKDLVEKSPDFKHINTHYMVFSIFVALLIFLPIGLMWSSMDRWALLNYGRRFYPTLVILFSAYAISQALFALVKGVYPTVRRLNVMYFVYDDVKVIRHTAKKHILSSVALAMFSVLFFFISSSKIQ